MGVLHAKEPNIPKDYGTPDTYPTAAPAQPKVPPRPASPGPDDNSGQVTVRTIDLHQRIRVDKVHIDGLKRTKDDIVKAQVMDLFKAKDFRQVVDQAQTVRNKLESIGCFKKIGVSIDTSKGPDSTPEGVEVTFNVKEMNRLSGGISTMVGNNEGSVLIQAKAPNIFGRGERLQVEYSYGSRSTTNINVSAIKPFVDNWLHTILTTSVFSTMTDVPWSGYKEKDNGILFDVAIAPGTLKHNFQYEATYRDIIATKKASLRVREQCGPSLKSALRHICSIDKRDDTIFPTGGSHVSFTTELAGLGGDTGFMKYDFTLQSNWTPLEFMTFQLGAQAGFLREISNDLQINITDLFFLGGPLHIRGFPRRGFGPHNEGNAMGGNTYWALALHLYTPLPFRPGKNSFGDLFRLHGFINGGNLGNISFQKDGDYSDNLKIFTDNVRCSAGVGIAMRLGGIARIELNLVMPLLMGRYDMFQQYQFGIGVQYL
ncbi:sorting and assembly machinery component 50 homolog [Microplitis mediator]|uniref:sorting and assembly machinery component 50 homolog n=1 Tax=Microplitis mediator TaxID=375433 RepID=UPI002553D998|nr:sorting and assembly machinery component 50 homolog [Microplitis mediator]